jgi:hypothetical protein
MAEDQAHEQNNKDVKTDGGAVGILDNESSLMKWMIGGPEIARLVKDFNRRKKKVKQRKDTMKTQMKRNFVKMCRGWLYKKVIKVNYS